MKSRLLLLSIAAMVISSCSATKTQDVADGSSMNNAIKARSVDNEYQIMKDRCPDCNIKSQRVTKNDVNNKHYDILTLTKPGGEDVTYYFDITSFYGRF